jgi:hypothetical protein
MRMQDTNAINYAVQQRWSLAVSLEN